MMSAPLTRIAGRQGTPWWNNSLVENDLPDMANTSAKTYYAEKCSMKNVNSQDCVPTHEIASSSTENILQPAPETQQISATELNGERCQNVDVAATHPPTTGDCGRAPVEGRPTASSTGDPPALRH
ncbi:hypothetical protein J6590_083116 [Homalodisca vitripennis]|nr:hypothetical protein J6590_083116 [Homalodisca vitripennis]